MRPRSLQPLFPTRHCRTGKMHKESRPLIPFRRHGAEVKTGPWEHSPPTPWWNRLNKCPGSPALAPLFSVRDTFAKARFDIARVSCARERSRLLSFYYCEIKLRYDQPASFRVMPGRSHNYLALLVEASLPPSSKLTKLDLFPFKSSSREKLSLGMFHPVPCRRTPTNSRSALSRSNWNV